MLCPHCESTDTKQLKKTTVLGYFCFKCRACQRTFNERTGTPFNFLEFPTDIVMLIVTWRLRYKLSLRDIPEMFLERGLVFTHEAVRDWEARFAPLLTDELRRRRKGSIGESWYVDETYIKVSGKWCYLYRAIDKEGNLVDCRFSEKRDMEAAKVFFAEALEVTGVQPDRVTTDGHDSYPRAIREELGSDVKHRTNRYLNNLIEQDHRTIKGRYKPMQGFKCPVSAARFCRAHEELRNFLKPDTRTNKATLRERRQHHQLQTQRIVSWF